MLDLRNYAVAGVGVIALLALSAVIVQEGRLQTERAAHADTRTQHAQQLQRLSDLTTRAAVAAQTAQQALQRSVAAIDIQRTQEKTDALTDNDSRRAADAAGPGRLRIPSACPARPASAASVPSTTAAPSVDPQAAEIPAAFRQELWDLRAALIEERAQLLALQDYARQCSAQGDKP